VLATESPRTTVDPSHVPRGTQPWGGAITPQATQILKTGGERRAAVPPGRAGVSPSGATEVVLSGRTDQRNPMGPMRSPGARSPASGCGLPVDSGSLGTRHGFEFPVGALNRARGFSTSGRVAGPATVGEPRATATTPHDACPRLERNRDARSPLDRSRGGRTRDTAASPA
jgi:hypothetical protein